MPVERIEDWSIYLAMPPMKGADNKKKATAQAGKVQEIKNLRVNLNAAGDRMDSAGNVWFTIPRIMGGSKRYNDTTVPAKVLGNTGKFRFNSDYHAISGTKDPWLYTSGMEGELAIDVQLSDGRKSSYNVKLHFAEPEEAKAGQRVFDVNIQGKTVLSGFDIIAKAGVANKAVTEVIKGIKAAGTMNIELAAVKGKPLLCAVEIIEAGL
jgi:hypothetical protein